MSLILRMVKKNKDLTDFYRNAYGFFNLLKLETEYGRKNYGLEDSRYLQHNYRKLLKDRDFFSFSIHYKSLRRMHLLKFLTPDSNVLDAGCGIGSDSLLCGIYGGEVLGIDINASRLNLAKRRISYYEHKYNQKIKVKFRRDNIFNISKIFDIIWVNEAISHIDPVDKFIRFCYKRLKEGGKLIIAENNKLNPYSYYKIKKAQKKWGTTIKIKKDPSTGEDITYAVERIFTIYQIKRLLSKLFREINIYPMGFFPYFIFRRIPSFCIKIEQRLLSKVPLIKSFAGSYVAIALK